MNKAIVVNLKDNPEFDAYVGRASSAPGVCEGSDGTFGNPFVDGQRATVVAKFKIYFHDRLRTDPEFRFKVEVLRGKRLACFCVPLQCHATVIADYVNSLEVTQ